MEAYSEDRGGVANTMRGIVGSVCAQKPDVVYFAGRAAALGALVQALPFRTCLELPVRIVAGDEAVEFATAVARGSSELRQGLEANASVTYTALAHPAAWRAAPSVFVPGSTRFLSDRCPNCLLGVFPSENLSDGEVIIGYDAVRMAVRAIRSPYGINDTPDLVAQELKRIHGTESVAGASGWISLAPTGEAINKAVPVLRVQPDGRVEFVALSFPAGTPCVPNQTPY
ncbi:MAG: ABC transporter substrate-binding protein [Pseudonocardia sp.]